MYQVIASVAESRTSEWRWARIEGLLVLKIAPVSVGRPEFVEWPSVFGSTSCTTKGRSIAHENPTILAPGTHDVDGTCYSDMLNNMPWEVRFDPAFELEFNALPPTVRDEILAQAIVLEQFGPTPGRPRVDALNRSRHTNMKELRFNADNGVWRVAFAFDPNRQAVLLVAGNKSGGSEKLFYRELIRKADDRFDMHMARLQEELRG